MRLPDYTYVFARYLGRPLEKWEAAIIAPLERMRQRKLRRRVIIVDPPRHDARELLCTYTRWLLTEITPDLAAYVYDRTKPEAEAAMNYSKAKDWPQIKVAGSFRPNSARASTYHYALLLSADEYHPRMALEIFDTIFGSIPSIGTDHMIIIHCRRNIPLFWVPMIYITNPELPDPPPDPPKTHPPIPTDLLRARDPETPLVLSFALTEAYETSPKERQK